MSLIMEQIKPEHPELFTLELGKITETGFVYTLAPNLDKMYITIRSRISSIMDLIGVELSELFALEFAKIANEILDEFNYGSNPTVTSGVICP